jgi:hypothetical protein
MKALPISRAKSEVIAHTEFDNKWALCYNTFMKSKIFINQRDNDKYFKQKMPTWRNGFCEIVRNVTIEKDPHDIYLDGEWGYITVYGRKIYVTRAGTEFAFEIRG